MQIEKAAEIGFCTGVRRAINMIERAATELGPLQTLGPIVHNQQVVDRLAEHGVTVAESLNQLKREILCISSHGVGPQVIQEAEARGIRIIDTTVRSSVVLRSRRRGWPIPVSPSLFSATKIIARCRECWGTLAIRVWRLSRCPHLRSYRLASAFCLRQHRASRLFIASYYPLSRRIWRASRSFGL